MQALLERIISSPENYARFLNTLSFLEYVGARKIIKSQSRETLSEQILAHSIEELRHARILKRAARNISSKCENYQPENLLCGTEAVHYFQTIDHAAQVELGEYDPWNCYLYTTILIEMRALDFYTNCEQMLQSLGKPSPFRGILVEEQRHLREVGELLTQIPDSEYKLTILRKIEEKEFAIFLQALEENVTLHA